MAKFLSGRCVFVRIRVPNQTIWRVPTSQKKECTDYYVNIVRLKSRYEWPYVFKGEHHIMLLKHLLKRYDFLRQGTTLRAYANRKQTRSG